MAPRTWQQKNAAPMGPVVPSTNTDTPVRPVSSKKKKNKETNQPTVTLPRQTIKIPPLVGAAAAAATRSASVTLGKRVLSPEDGHEQGRATSGQTTKKRHVKDDEEDASHASAGDVPSVRKLKRTETLVVVNSAGANNSSTNTDTDHSSDEECTLTPAVIQKMALEASYSPDDYLQAGCSQADYMQAGRPQEGYSLAGYSQAQEGYSYSQAQEDYSYSQAQEDYSYSPAQEDYSQAGNSREDDWQAGYSQEDYSQVDSYTLFEPEAAGAVSEDNGVTRAHFEATLVRSEATPVHSKAIRSEAIHGRSKAVHGRPEVTHSRSKVIHDRSEAIHGRSEAIHGHSEATRSRSEAIHSRSEATHSRSEVTHSHSGMHAEATHAHSKVTPDCSKAMRTRSKAAHAHSKTTPSHPEGYQGTHSVLRHHERQTWGKRPRYAILVFLQSPLSTRISENAKLSCEYPFEVQVGPDARGGVTLRPRSPTVAFTTRDQWTSFQPYSLERRGERNVPEQFLRAARWREYRGDTGYFVDFAGGPTRFRPVEFNFENVCWTEVTWNPIDNRWDVTQGKYPTEHSGDASTEPQTRNHQSPIQKKKGQKPPGKTTTR
ncbi:hypothetical protein EDB89DRAFT_1915035 [Lactarius sanguifluus]|nr:hypothetical protein EDB89DRAFT_1915035 [Lactarius sanguifluus]